MSSRHKAREIALQFLYRHDPEITLETARKPFSGSDLAHDLTAHFDHFQVPEDAREFAGLLVAGTIQKIGEIDPMIEQQASNWKLARMAPVDRCILRMATYEMTHFSDTAPSIIINEAVELAKHFGTEDTPAFINGILDSLKTKIRE